MLRVAMAMFTMRTHCFDRQLFSTSSILAPIQLPSPREIHLWYLIPDNVKSESLLKNYMEILSPSEKENVLRLPGEDLRKRALLARALVRTTIARYQINSQVDPRSLKFGKNIHGKPELEWQDGDYCQPPPLQFNISHTSSLIACGVTVNSPIGIDVEEKHRKIKHDILSLARRYFSKHEVQILSAISDPQVLHQEFIKLWTLKEAYVKALGRGFSGAPFKTFTIHFRGSTSTNSEATEILVNSLDNPDITINWQFVLLELTGSHYAAICTEKDYSSGGKNDVPRRLSVWETVPFLEDKCVSGTDAVVTVSRLT